MRPGPIILLFATIGLVAVFVPHLDAGGGAKRGAAVPQPSHPAPAAWFAGETVLARSADGHFYADVGVAQHETRFLVDTGASMVALTASDARAIGLDWNDSDLRPIGRGAAGVVEGVPVVLERMELGGMEARQVQAAIVPDGLPVSLLGQSFLSRIANVRIEGNRMTLAPQAR